MLEFLLCSLFTVLPDYLLRRHFQGKRWGSEIDFFTMWYELRWGLTACLLGTVVLITIIFYYHPSTTNAIPAFRTLTILPEHGGRVEEVFVENNQRVEPGQALFSLTDESQLAAMSVARGRVDEVRAQFAVAQSDLSEAEGDMLAASGALERSRNELRMREEVRARDARVVSEREIDRMRLTVTQRTGELEAETAKRDAVRARLQDVLPARLAQAREELERLQVEQEKTTVYAGVNGHVAQFALKPGDYVSPILRPAGLLIPSDPSFSDRPGVQAGFSQLAGQVIKPGTVAEIACLTKPFTIIPMVVVEVQNVIPAGQVRPTDQLVDPQDRARPGTLTVLMEPLYEGGIDDVKPGSKCIANAYTNNHELIASGELGIWRKLFLHMVDTIGIVHAVILRAQALLLPVQMLVFAGH